MLIPAWAQHLGPSSLQTPDPLAHLMAKTAQHKGVQGQPAVGLLEIIHICALPQLPTATVTQHSYLLPSISSSFVQDISLLPFQAYINFGFLHLNISTFVMDSHGCSFKSGQATSLDEFKNSKYLHSPKPHLTTLFPRDSSLCEFRTKQ